MKGEKIKKRKKSVRRCRTCGSFLTKNRFYCNSCLRVATENYDVFGYDEYEINQPAIGVKGN